MNSSLPCSITKCTADIGHRAKEVRQNTYDSVPIYRQIHLSEYLYNTTQVLYLESREANLSVGSFPLVARGRAVTSFTSCDRVSKRLDIRSSLKFDKVWKPLHLRGQSDESRAIINVWRLESAKSSGCSTDTSPLSTKYHLCRVSTLLKVIQPFQSFQL